MVGPGGVSGSGEYREMHMDTKSRISPNRGCAKLHETVPSPLKNSESSYVKINFFI
jgi:hypothetical protein